MNPQEVGNDSPVQSLQTLARERLPSRELWPGIEQRIAQRQELSAARRRWLSASAYGLAASVVAAVLAGLIWSAPQPITAWVATLPVPGAVTSEPEPAAVASTSTPYSNPEMQAHGSSLLSTRVVRTLRSESLDNAPAMVAERADRSALLKASYAGSDSATARPQNATLRAKIRLVRQAEREVQRALRIDPESASLKSLLAAAQQKRERLVAKLAQGQD